MKQLLSGHRQAAGRAPVVRLGGTSLPVAGRARVYVCGITPYDVAHLGHPAASVWPTRCPGCCMRVVPR